MKSKNILEIIHDHAMSKAGVSHDFKPEWNAGRYLIEGKMFVMVGEYKDGQKIITIKLDPLKSDLLRKEGLLIPGYYMNKLWWNSCFYEQVSSDFVKELIDDSYDILFASLPLKKRKEIQLQ